MLFDEPTLYFAPTDDAYYQQGDVILAPCVLLDDGPANLTVPAGLGQPARRQFWAEEELHKTTVGEAALVPAMVTSHDCVLDKDFNRRYRQLRQAGATRDAAIEEAASDDSLDRYLTVAPIVPLAEVPSGDNELRANHVIGYFPVCGDAARGIDEGVVDLARPTTLDRSVIVGRLGILSEDARAALIYAVARFWAFRAPKLTFELEHAIGRKIVDVRIDGAHAIGLTLELDDGEELSLLQAPNTEAGSGPERPTL